jgi:RimJ/RimL family protein N-acetyltransferase
MAYFRKMEGNLCYLSPIDANDYHLFAKWVNDLEASLGMIFLHSIISLDKEKEILNRLQEGSNFTIVDAASDAAIGSCGIPSIDERNRHCQIGIFIGDPEKRGKGYGTEAMSLLVEFAFHILNMHSVSLRVYDYNKPAIRCYEKVGFKVAGRLRHAKRIGGIWHDEILMDILEDEFESKIIGPALARREGRV